MFKLDLSGRWQVLLDADKHAALPTEYPDEIILPGTTSAAGLGPANPARETYFLTDAQKFEGFAWFMRTFESGDWHGMQIMLTLERTRKTTVYLDGAEIGSQGSLCAPHRYFLPEISAGVHTLIVRVDNTNYPTRGGHLTSQDTQSNWNGITGEISLTVAKAIVTGFHTLLAEDGLSMRIRAAVHGSHPGFASVLLPGQMEQLLPISGDLLDGVCPLTGTEAMWDEFAPAVHTLAVDVDGDVYETTFGLRRFEGQGRTLLWNGREAFLRGKHDGLIFPRTGYAPTDADSWRKVLQIAKDYGINHYRFHTCCPPDAAFTAADELGIVMSPEIPFWGTVADEGEEGYDPTERHFLISEGFRMLDEYSHHPSFVFMSLGNELWGSKAALNRMLANYRAYDPDKLYISGSNNFQWVPEILQEEDVFVGVRFSSDRLFRGSYAMCDAPQGIVQLTEPESVTNYDQMIAPQIIPGDATSGASGKIAIQYGTGVKYVDAESAQAFVPEVPVISHEVGQYQFYPDFDEIAQYTGPLKARNFEVFRERLQAAGLWPDHDRFFRSAGKLAVDCYRREIETFLRTQELSGFQLLDLQDFTGQGTALVGVLNAFMESKGLITPEEWRQFCASTVVLGEFDKFVYSSGEEIRFAVQVSECNPAIVHDHVLCQLLQGDQVVSEQRISVVPTGRRLTGAVPVSLGQVWCDHLQTCTVQLTLEDGTVNRYPIWVFPEYDLTITQEGIVMGNRRVAFVRTAGEAAASPVPAIVIPDSEGKLPAAYASDFWCYPMFRSISEHMGKPLPVGTLGLCIEPRHPFLQRFTQDDYTTPAWYPLLQTAHCEHIDCSDPAVQMIDNTERCHRLCLLWTQEGVPHMTFRLWENPANCAVRAFAASLVEALA